MVFRTSVNLSVILTIINSITSGVTAFFAMLGITLDRMRNVSKVTMYAARF